MKKSTLKSTGILALVILLCLSIISGCSSQKLSSDFNEEEVKKATENVIGLINDRNSEGIRALCTVQLKDALTDEVFDKMFEAIDEGGNFTEMGDMSIGGATDKSTEEEFAVVVAKAKYEIKTFTFTITFTKQMKLAGIYVK
jgi:hypothetical protein